MAELSITFRTACKECGTALEADAYDETRTGWLVEVAPCETCMEKAEGRGYERCERENGL